MSLNGLITFSLKGSTYIGFNVIPPLQLCTINWGSHKFKGFGWNSWNMAGAILHHRHFLEKSHIFVQGGRKLKSNQFRIFCGIIAHRCCLKCGWQNCNIFNCNICRSLLGSETSKHLCCSPLTPNVHHHLTWLGFCNMFQPLRPNNREAIPVRHYN